MAATIYTLDHGVATFTTGAATKSLELAPGPGNFTINNVQASNRAAIQVMNRNRFLALVHGPEEPVTGTITVLVDGAYTAAGSARPLDAIMGAGYYSGETTDDPGGLVWTGIVKLVSTRAAAVQTFTLVNVRLTGAFAEGAEGNTIVLSYTAYGNGSGDALSMTSA